MVVELDETYMSKRHGNRGHRVRRNPKWIFTMVERGTGRSFMRVVRDRTRATLLPIIFRHVRPLSEVRTDGWLPYRILGILPQFRHKWVNHSLHFVDPADHDNHTQTIENKNGLWKDHVRRCRGLYDRAIRPHMKEFLWRERFGSRNDVFYNLWSQIASQYPTNP